MNKKTLIFRIGEVGDTIVSIPTIRKIFQINSKTSDLYLLLNKEQNNSFLDLIGNDINFKQIFYYENRFQSLYKLFKNLKKERFSSLYYLMPERNIIQFIRDKIFFHYINPGKIYGMKLKNQRRKKTTNNIYESEMNRVYRSIFNNNITTKEISEYYYLTLGNKTFFTNKDTFNIAFCIKSKFNVKNWPTDYWRSLIETIYSKYKFVKFYFVGSKEDEEYIKIFIKSLKKINHKTIKNYSGKLTLLESADLINECDFYIGLDTGPSHIASIVKTKSINIFSSRNIPNEWFPLNSRVIYHDVNCKGCRLQTCLKYNAKCIKSITPNEVYMEFIKVTKNMQRFKYFL